MIYTVTLSPALDKSYTIPGFAVGKVNRVLESRSDPGGKGINVSKTIKALGGSSVAMGIVGGQTGRDILNRLTEMGIEHDFVFSSIETRTNIKISDPQSNATTDINEKTRLDAKDGDALLTKLLQRLTADDMVVIAGKIDINACDIGDWIRIINEKHARVCLDTEGKALRRGASAAPFLIKPNEDEFAALTEKNGLSLDELALEAMRTCRNLGITHVVVSLGERGALFADRNGAQCAAAPEVTPLSTVGAGDAMCAGLCYGLNSGLALSSTYRLSLACGSAAVCCPGSQSPTAKQIKALLPLIKTRRIL